MDKLFRELRRRNVFRIAGVYAVISWLLVQIAVALEAALEMPSWFDAVVTSLLLIGFPIAIIFAWAFEMTPQGVKRTAAVSPEDSITDRTGRKLDYALLGGLVIVAAIVLGDRFIPRLDDNGPAVQVTSTAPAASGADLSDKSIAVLPFADMSAEGDQEYFADGLSEELLNVLAKIDGLQIAGRTSSFAFKGDNRDLREIGDILNVAHILEGSVRKSGNQIRVTAQLINTSNGYHVYSDTFEGDLSDIFAVQDEIAAEITRALRTEWLGEDAAEEDAPSDFAAFDLYLQARQLIYTRDKDKMEQAERLLDRAVEIDPAYAPAWAQKAIVNVLLSNSPGSYGDRPQLEAAQKSLEMAEKAIVLDRSLGEAYGAKGLALSNLNGDLDEVIATLRLAIELNPGLSEAKTWLATAYLSNGDSAEQRKVYEEIVETDPLFGPAFNNLINDYAYTGAYEKAEALIDRMERVKGDTKDTLMARGFVAQSRGDVSEAATYFDRALELDASSTVLQSSATIEMGKLGEYERSLELAMFYQRPVVLAVLGRTEEALAELENMPTPDDAGAFMLGLAFIVYDECQMPEEMIAYFDRYYDSIEEAIDESPNDALAWLTYLANAFKVTGDTERLAEALEYMREAIELERGKGASAMNMAGNLTYYEAVAGDKDAALGHLQDWMDAGLVSDFSLGSMALDPLRNDQRFKEIEVEMNTRVNRERREYGLPDRQGM
ncbi:tetratricopeptide repeat protein [Parvularcula flava]|uniref:Tetratricopeptide repeat protein n=1 Tax=Aquisalinus luteolus TaxID=1566827 RepID=A0A8J3A207_9PROT|nr:tetratricopeptide repeat protein [Aquisalinus luteolus]NHK26644.1 tetratricopeptide repeat protein [Aquisalinus luteolus]GGH92970.1 hypothetical protein GCM10011355_03710 [Aquisalinus luteolus]